jgi:N-acetylmuramoyl-L-alanine amidase
VENVAEPPARPALIIAAAAFAAALGVTGCGPSGREAAVHPVASQPAASAAPAASAVPASPSPTPTPAAPLAGKTVGIDPGHNGRNKDDPAYLNRMVFNGRAMETCDTTGTESNSGYAEAAFTFAVATDLRADLIRDGARVVMTRQDNDGVGPCVDRRAQILNAASASVAIDIHGDGGPAAGRGFTVLEPVADGPNDGVIASSLRFGADVHAAMLAGTGMPIADYYGQDGYISRDDLAGLNLTTVPKILIECGNMRNATDARMMISSKFQHRIARAFAKALTTFALHS